jgi:Secretion system C-terminal sorting domain
MKNLINILIISLLGFLQTFALVEIPIKVVDEKGGTFLNSPLMIGISEDASYGIDTELGELELFPGKPPGEINLCALKIEQLDQTSGLKLWSNKDLRPQTNEDKQYQKYLIKLYYFQKDLRMNFSFDENNIDSIKVTDIQDGIFLSENITDAKTFFYDNENLRDIEFFIHVWYNFKVKSINDNYSDKEIKYNNSLLVSTKFMSELIIYNINGLPVHNNRNTVKKIDLSSLRAGIYFLRAKVENKMINKKIIISR